MSSKPERAAMELVASVGAQDGAETRPRPRPPRHLGPAGRRTWRAVTAHAPVLVPELDVLTIRRLCELVDEREVIRAELERGVLLGEPIVTPRGSVVGERLVANPAYALLRQLDRRIDDLSDRLAITPKARGALGLVLTAAERGALELQALLVAKYRKEPQ